MARTSTTLPYISETSECRHLAPLAVWVTSTMTGSAKSFCILQGHETVSRPSERCSEICSSYSGSAITASMASDAFLAWCLPGRATV